VFNLLAGGFLTSHYTRNQIEFNDSERLDPNRKQGQLHRLRYWNEPNFKALDLLRPVIALHSITEIEAALRWLTHHSELRKEFGDAAIVGASSTKHLEENLEACLRRWMRVGSTLAHSRSSTGIRTGAFCLYDQ
jgi:aflatoxin B1 aldehyde reductase